MRGKLAYHVGDHVVLSPEGAVLVTSPGDGIVVSPPSSIVEQLAEPGNYLSGFLFSTPDYA